MGCPNSFLTVFGGFNVDLVEIVCATDMYVARLWNSNISDPSIIYLLCFVWLARLCER